MANTMYVHNVVIFNAVDVDNTVLYKATNIKNCFFHKVSKVTDTPNGLSFANVGTCVIPASSLPDVAFVPPLEWQAASLDDIESKRLVTLREEDIIASGYCDTDYMSANDIFAKFEAFTIQSITKDDFSSHQGYLLKGV